MRMFKIGEMVTNVFEGRGQILESYLNRFEGDRFCYTVLFESGEMRTNIEERYLKRSYAKMTKSDLKTGMKVKLRSGEEYIVFKDSIEGNVLVNKSSWLSIPNYNETLSHKEFSNYDIFFVYVPKAVPYILDMDCKYWEQVWERESIKEITLDDVERKFGCKVKIVNKF